MGRSKTPFSSTTRWQARSVPNRRDFRKSGLDWQCFFDGVLPRPNPRPDCGPFPNQLDNYTHYTQYEHPNGYDDKEKFYTSDYIFNLPASEDGNKYWYVYYLDVEMPGPSLHSSVYNGHFKFTTESGVTPESLPYEDCG